MSEALVEKARGAATKAHAPYSHFHVGCAVESVDGLVAVGANMENACYRLGICAEQSALAAAAQAFGLDKVARIVVAGGPVGGEHAAPDYVTPCGGCRQAIAEAAVLGGRDIEIVCAPLDGEGRFTTSIAQLLPNAFTL